MAIHYPKPSANNTAEYQVSGIPFVTSSVYNEVDTSTAVQVRFPYVTQWIQIVSIGFGNLRVGFTENGVKSNPDANYFMVASGSIATRASATAVGGAVSERIPVRCKEIWILGSTGNDPTNKAGFTVLAGLTNVKSREFPTITGSNGFEGVG